MPFFDQKRWFFDNNLVKNTIFRSKITIFLGKKHFSFQKWPFLVIFWTLIYGINIPQKSTDILTINCKITKTKDTSLDSHYFMVFILKVSRMSILVRSNALQLLTRRVVTRQVVQPRRAQLITQLIYYLAEFTQPNSQTTVCGGMVRNG